MAKLPVKMTPELGKEICDVVSTSPKMLEELCKENLHWPTAKYIYKHRIFNEKFGKDYARAKQSQIEVLVSHIFQLTRDNSEDYYHDGEALRINHAAANRRRLEIDSIKWLAGKLAPKLYGEKVQDNNAKLDLNDIEKYILDKRVENGK